MEIKRRTKEFILKPITVPTKESIQTDYKITWWDKVCIWLNGKKLKIGAVCTLVAGVLLLLGVKGPVTMITGAISILLDGIGVLHKGLKAQTKYGEKGEFSEKDLSNLLRDTWNVVKGWIAFIKNFKKKRGD